MKLVDMFGLLRCKGDFNTPWFDLIQSTPPEVILTRPWFVYAKQAQEKFPGQYRWHQFRGLLIGLRYNVAQRLESQFQKLPAIYSAIDLKREYPWPKNREQREP